MKKVSNAEEKLFNLEVQQDNSRYILSAQLQGNEIAVDELNSVLAVSHAHVKNVSVIFENSKAYIRAIVLRGISNSTARKVFDSSPFHECSN
jgi:hypothetical protein